MSNSDIQIGEYILKPLDDDSYWLESPNGEGTGIDQWCINSIIEAYFTGTLDEYFKKIM